MVDKSDKFFCQEIINNEQINNLCKLTQEEIKQMYTANLNSFQKQLLINKIKQNSELSFIDLHSIIQFNNVEIPKESNTEIKQKINYKHLY